MNGLSLPNSIRKADGFHHDIDQYEKLECFLS